MKRISLLMIVFICSNLLYGQLSGTKTIPGDYATIAAAVADLNAQGVGSGGVTFDVIAGHVENITAPILVTATGSASALVEFRKSGAGANPSITRTDAGSINTGTLGGDGDAVVRLSGTDYFTWRQINLNAGNQGIEYGFMTHKPDGANGSQYVNVLNSVITLTKGSSAYVTGIYISNGPVSTLSATGVTVTSASGQNRMITIAGNTIQNVHSGILVVGSLSKLHPDESITVGVYQNGNNIQNFGGGNTATAYGIYFSGITSPEAYSNDIENQTAHNGSYSGIQFSSAKGHVACSYNTIVVNNSSTNASTIQGIYCSSVVASNTYEWNTFAAYPISSTGSFYWIRTSGNTEFSYISDNGDFGGTTKASGQMYCIYMNGPSSEECEDYIGNNSFGSITVNGGANSLLTGIFYNITGNAVQSCQIDANYLYGLANNGSGETKGIDSRCGSSQMMVSYNTVGQVTGAGNVTGIYYNGFTPYVYNNTVSNLTAAGPDLIAIDDDGTGTSRCYRNIIYNLTSTHSAPFVRGINAGTSYISNIYNNYISDLRTPNADKSLALAGIYISSGVAVNVYFNTIFLNAASSGALFGSAGIYQSFYARLDLRNNNIINISTPNGALGYTIAFQFNTELSYYSELSNCNNFYAGTPGPNRLIFRSYNNLMQTLDAYKNLISTRDGASISENPPFINAATAPYNLHLQTSVPTQCEKGGRPVTSPISVSNDFDGNARNTNFPDIGADEFAGMALDQLPPVISFTPLKHTANTGNRTLQTTITDPSGVAVSGSGLPMLYWRVGAGAYTGVQATHIGGNSYDFTFGGGVFINNVVQYFIVAHDQATTPNIGSKPYGGSGFSTNPPACATPPANPYSYTIKAGISGIVNVEDGSYSGYSSLTGFDGLFEDINNKVVTGDITALISSDLLETGYVWLSQWLEDGPGNYTLTIAPDDSVNRHVAGDALAAEVISFIGADRVIVDGRYNGSGNYLTFSNNSLELTNSVFNILSMGHGAGSNNITIRNCNILAGNSYTTTSYGIFSEGYDNENLSILDNIIKRAGQGVKIIGYAPNGTIDNLLIQGNSIGSMTGFTVWHRGISISGAIDPVISNNEIINILTDYAETNAGIEVMHDVTGALISHNEIHGLRSIDNGGKGTFGIYINALNPKNITISNNLIYDLITDGGGSSTINNPFGIRVTGGSGIQIYHNSIHLGGSFLNLSGNHISAALYISGNAKDLDVRNNILANTMTGAAGVQPFAVYLSSATFSTIDHNDYFGLPLAYNGSAVNTLADWQLYTGQDENSIAADPLFTGLKLQLLNPSSPVIGNASPIDVVTDFSGNPRHPVHPTMGAREYLPASSWLGNTSAWNTGSNWSKNVVPDDSYNVIIPTSPAGGNFPVVPAGVFQCNSLQMETGSSLSIQGQLEVKD